MIDRQDGKKSLLLTGRNPTNYQTVPLTKHHVNTASYPVPFFPQMLVESKMHAHQIAGLNRSLADTPA